MPDRDAKDFQRGEHDEQRYHEEKLPDRSEEYEEHEKRFQHFLQVRAGWLKTATRWEGSIEFIPTEDYDLKLQLRISNQLQQFLEMIQDFYESLQELGVKLMVVYEYFKYEQKENKYHISLKLSMGIPLHQNDEEGYTIKILTYEDIYSIYLDLRQRITDLLYQRMAGQLGYLQVLYMYFNSVLWSKKEEEKEDAPPE